ncbi:GGDEF domain-containing protein [Mixta calida]|uniref:Sensor domain-containing diguanylate cyclase n=1 Tax=Mixta calida TaxID=665913 RepID=A0ABN5HAF3_9GAMM|nr:sensor domain-containing diguanylate cyclase [Mixta calida]AUY23702.1 sensor domain-containing diguanylate cyclase [Mixta calida]ORM63861.1 GGDEF domain-containing protein [Mixta calida]
MKTPEIPANEPQRLDELHALRLLNTPAEERFDRLTRLAKRLFNVTASVVSLLDADHQWFKSGEGVTAKQTPRDISFCGHVILQNDVMIVEDARKDERFYDNPLVTGEPQIRFYAGCPLRAPNGSKVGTLCILDSQTRDFTADDIHALRDLASMAESELVSFQASTSGELTQISNRRGFMTLGQMLLKECALRHCFASLAFFDLDRFKEINDNFGHREGDRALMDFADALKISFRQSALFARLGGDEFVVLFIDMDQQQAAERLEAFRHELEQHMKPLQRRYRLDFSVGTVGFDPAQPQPLASLLSHSDDIMYQHKKARRNSG